MSAVWDVWSVLIAIGATCWLAGAWLAVRSVRGTAELPPWGAQPLPPLAVLLAARDEERDVEACLRSLVAADYPNLRIIAVNDRSADSTGEILDNLAAEYPDKLQALHITALPPGWLGKTHALHVACAHAADAQWLLFTDADVTFHPQALRTAMAAARQDNADHVVAFPRMSWNGYLEACLLALFVMSINIGYRLWKIGSPSLKSYIGIGAFNMVRREKYRQFAGHTALRLEVVDDMKLGYLVKKYGGRTTVFNSDGQVRVRWRSGALDVVRALERSGFSGMNFSWLKLAGTVAFLILIMLAPLIIPLAAPTALPLTCCGLALAGFLTAYGITARGHGLPAWIGLLHPAACVLLATAFVRSAVVTHIRGGLSWRDTFYTIAELKGGNVK